MATDLAPKIWMYWEQGWDNAPVLVQECANSWERLNPEYQVVRLDRDSIEGYLGSQAENMAFAWRCPIQLRSDLLRLSLLIEHGGVWADATLYCRQALRGWLPPITNRVAFFFSNPGPDRLIASWFISAPAGSEILGKLLDEFTRYLEQVLVLWQPTLRQRLLRRIYGLKLNRSVASTLGWWNPNLIRRSIWPYFIFHYCYNRLILTDSRFAELSSHMPILSAAPSHALQLAGKAGRFEEARTIMANPDIPVHKLNWRLAGKSPEWMNIIQDLNED